jgi:hypothetical protein
MEKKHTLIYGASDDCVILQGQIDSEYTNWTLAQRGIPFECSDGTKGKIIYDGDWKFSLETKGSLFKELRPSAGDIGKHSDLASKCTPYSDVLILEDGIFWVKMNGKKV